MQTYTTTFGGKELTIKTGQFAQAANASCTVQMGETVVMVTAVMGRESDRGYFPLMVDFEEKLYAAGRIKGSRFIKREGRPSDEAVLVARFIDRALRPLFPEGFMREVQVIVTALSFDEENDPDILGLIGASAVLHMSDIPWHGPIGAVRISEKKGETLINASYEQRTETDYDLDIAGSSEKVVMIEARANEATEDQIEKAFERGRTELTPVISLIEEMREKEGKEKFSLEPTTEEEKQLAAEKERILNFVRERIAARSEELFFSRPLASKAERGAAKEQLTDEIVAELEKNEEPGELIGYAKGLMYDEVQNMVSDAILKDGKRLDGRGLHDVRDLISEVALLPRVHGSGHFMRGETEVLSVCTLGAPGDHQILDNMETVGEKHYMHHYNFPPYSVGEAKPLRGAGRREIGHGALAEKALEPVLPSKEDFPYTIRVVSEVLTSNGSSSMGSTCGSTLALMDAGVPITKPVAGLAIGLASRPNGDATVITDIQDLEDGPGGMDFKVTGTEDGITAIQMDTKTHGITHDVVVEALAQAKEGRLHILKTMTAAIAAPRAELSEHAPRITSLNIDPEKIRDVIGSGGKTINEIIETTGVESIDIEQDGMVMISSKDAESAEKAREWVEGITSELKPGQAFEGTVVRILDFGAIVDLGYGKDGMVHVSELAPWRVGSVDKIVSEGDKVHVKVLSVEDGRVGLSMKQAEGNEYTDEMRAASEQKPEDRPPRREHSGDRRGGGNRDRNRGRR
jgi:polyribonucleotide nucleotidyltransferase